MYFNDQLLGLLFLYVVFCAKVHKGRNAESPVKIGITLITGLHNFKHSNIPANKTKTKQTKKKTTEQAETEPDL